MFEVYIDLHNQTVYSNIVDKLNKNSIITIIFKNFSVLLQFRSSDESLQSAIRLQRHDSGIHRPPVSHLHSLIPQASNHEHTKQLNSVVFFSIHCRKFYLLTNAKVKNSNTRKK